MNNEYTRDEIMDTVNNTSDLHIAIKKLENKQMLMEEDLQDRFHAIVEGLKPANILKNTLHEVQESTVLKHNLLKIALGLGAGYFSRKLVVGKSAGLIKKALGTALQFGITQFIAKKDDSDDGYQSKKKNIFKRILSI